MRHDTSRNAELARLRDLYDHAPVGYCTIDESGMIVEANLTLAKWFGYDAKGLISLPFSQFVSVDDRPQFSAQVRNALESSTRGASSEDLKGITQVCSLRMLKSDNTLLMAKLNMAAEASRDDEASLLRIVLTSENTQQALTTSDHTLRATEARTELIIQAANVGLWDWDLITNQVYFSPEWKMQLGYANNEIENLYEEWESRVHPNDREGALEAVKEFRTGLRAIFDIEFRMRHRDGSWRWMCARADIQRDATGNAVRIMGCHIDITDRKKADEERVEAFARLEKIASRVPGVVYQFRMRPDGTTCFPYASEGIRALFRVSPEEIREDGSKAYRYHHPDDEADLYKAIEKSRQDLSPFSHEFRLKFPEGSERRIFVNSLPEREEDGSTLWHGYINDITERRQAEEALQLSREDLNQAQRLAHMGSWQLDTASYKVVWSHQLYRMCGYDPSLPPPPYTEHQKLFTVESWEKLSTAVLQTRDTGLPYELELEMVRGDGSQGWMWVRGEAVQDANGITIALRGVAQDITDRKRAEAALQESEHRWQFALEGGRDGVWDWNLPAQTVFFSKRWKEILGYREDEIGDDIEEWKKRLHPDDVEKVMSDLRAHLDGAKPNYSNEHRTRCKDGNWKWIHDQGLVISRDANGKPLRMIGTYSDITERKQTEAALRDSQAIQKNAASLQMVTTSARVGLVVVDKDHRFVFANAAYSSILNIPTDLVGRSFAEVLPDAYEVRIRPRLNRAFAGERMDYELRLPTSDGPIYCAVNYEPVMKGNTVESVAIVVMDITAQRNTEEQLRQSQKMEAIGQLAGGIAHDFNNLLTIIGGYTNLLIKKLSPADPAWDFLNEIGVAGKRAAELTRSLLAFSHQQVRLPESVELNDIVIETQKLLQRSIGEGVEITIALEPNPSTVWMDRSELSQVLLNLSINARDAMENQGRITIKTESVTVPAADHIGSPSIEPGEYILLTVADTGSGMTEEVQRRIFEPFFTTKPVGKGTGLGLAMVHGIISRSGGIIRVASSLGQGTVFSIYLPRAKESERLPLNPAKPRRTLGGDETILLVEDDATVRGLTRTILTEYGYNVIEASSGQFAIDTLLEQRDRIQLLVTDVVMPGMNGAVLVEQVQKLAPGIPVLFISGYVGETSTRERLLQSSVNFLQKPFAPNDLALKVRDAIDRQPNGQR